MAVTFARNHEHHQTEAEGGRSNGRKKGKDGKDKMYGKKLEE